MKTNKNVKVKSPLQEQMERLKKAVTITKLERISDDISGSNVVKYNFTRGQYITTLGNDTQLIENEKEIISISVNLNDDDQLLLLPSLFQMIRTEVKHKLDFITKSVPTKTHSLESTILKFLKDQKQTNMSSHLTLSKIIMQEKKDPSKKK